jgi:transcriptional regulator
MYIPKHYEKSDLAALHALIDAHPLGSWVTVSADGITANHIPFLIDSGRGEFGTLVGHVARANPVWRSLAQDCESMVIFQAEGAYISPSWCPSKREHGKVVPTWNYSVVHAHGAARAIHDHAWLLQLVERLTTKHESGRDAPWRVADAPEDYIARRLDAIVGVEIPIRRIEGKWKASQMVPLPDKLGIVAGLRSEARADSAAMARLMEEQLERDAMSR